MQGRENSAESRLHLKMSREVYPGHCGYSSETGGIMKNLRESTSNSKVGIFILFYCFDFLINFILVLMLYSLQLTNINYCRFVIIMKNFIDLKI